MLAVAHTTNHPSNTFPLNIANGLSRGQNRPLRTPTSSPQKPMTTIIVFATSTMVRAHISRVSANNNMYNNNSSSDNTNNNARQNFGGH